MNIKTQGRQLERYFKGMANHRRIAIFQIVAGHDGITVEGIADILRANFKTISQHTRVLAQAGLIHKYYQGRAVAHTLSPHGKRFIKFLKTAL